MLRAGFWTRPRYVLALGGLILVLGLIALGIAAGQGNEAYTTSVCRTPPAPGWACAPGDYRFVPVEASALRPSQQVWFWFGALAAGALTLALLPAVGRGRRESG